MGHYEGCHDLDAKQTRSQGRKMEKIQVGNRICPKQPGLEEAI
jgi:hypothetical protein